MSETAAAAPAASTPAVSSTPSAPVSSGSTSAPNASASTPTVDSGRTQAGTSLPHQDGAGGVTPAGDSDKATAAKEAEVERKFKLKAKVNGVETEREYSQEEMQLYLQKGLGADAKFQEAAQLRKTFQSFVDAVKADPFKAFSDPAFKDIGDFKEHVIKSLANEFEAEERKKADPRAYELEEYKAKVAKYEAAEAASREAATKASEEENNKRMWADTKKTWVEELEKSGFGDNPAFIRQMAEIGREFIDEGLDLNPRNLISEMKLRMEQQHRTVLGGLKGEQLATFLGNDTVNELLRYKVEQLNAAKPKQEPIKPPGSDAAPETDKSPENTNKRDSLKGYYDFLRGS